MQIRATDRQICCDCWWRLIITGERRIAKGDSATLSMKISSYAISPVATAATINATINTTTINTTTTTTTN